MVRKYSVTPEEFGVPRAPIEAVRGGTAAENATLIRQILSGEAGAARDIVAINAAAALVAAGVAGNFPDGAELASSVLSSGDAKQTLERLVEFTSAS
jgi:anthranilate phosphoribosyltransferase